MTVYTVVRKSDNNHLVAIFKEEKDAQKFTKDMNNSTDNYEVIQDFILGVEAA